jgi:Leucine Rich repeat
VNSSLTTLNLSYNDIDDKGAFAIAKALKQISSLKSLILVRVSMGVSGVLEIANAMKVNSSFTP